MKSDMKLSEVILKTSFCPVSNRKFNWYWIMFILWQRILKQFKIDVKTTIIRTMTTNSQLIHSFEERRSPAAPQGPSQWVPRCSVATKSETITRAPVNRPNGSSSSSAFRGLFNSSRSSCEGCESWVSLFKWIMGLHSMHWNEPRNLYL